MKWIQRLHDRLRGLTYAINRFPLTSFFLLAAAAFNTYAIHTKSEPFSKYMLAGLVGAFLSAVAQVAYERFFSKTSARYLLLGMVLLLTVGYYFIILPAPALRMVMMVRTAVAVFALFFAFIWVPVIKSEISFNKSFMISFKSYFNSMFFSGVIFAGISIILSATSALIFEIDSNAFAYAATIIFVLFAPMYYLSLIPIYLGFYDQTEESIIRKKEVIDKAAAYPKFLEILLSYIVIPLIAVFTLILVVYIFKSVGGEFWKDNSLEPMLVSYAITVILVYILASELENKFTTFFKKVFPKVLVPIVLFQITSSILVMGDNGITHNRYFVILFGIFAAIAGVLLSFLSVRKNGLIAAILIVFATIAIVPPFDAFTISRSSQINRLESVLEKNSMLENNKIIPKDSISKEDKLVITEAVQYLNMMHYTKKIDWLPDNFESYRDFEKTFGFQEYYVEPDFNEAVYLALEQPTQINIKGNDTFVQTDIYLNNQSNDEKICDLEIDGKSFTLIKSLEKDQAAINLVGENEQALIRFDTKQIYDRFADYSSKGTMSVKDATFTEENDHVKMTIVVQNLDFDKSGSYRNAQLYVFVEMK
jgi:hypothetical protein